MTDCVVDTIRLPIEETLIQTLKYERSHGKQTLVVYGNRSIEIPEAMMSMLGLFTRYENFKQTSQKEIKMSSKESQSLDESDTESNMQETKTCFDITSGEKVSEAEMLEYDLFFDFLKGNIIEETSTTVVILVTMMDFFDMHESIAHRVIELHLYDCWNIIAEIGIRYQGKLKGLFIQKLLTICKSVHCMYNTLFTRQITPLIFISSIGRQTVREAIQYNIKNIGKNTSITQLFKKISKMLVNISNQKEGDPEMDKPGITKKGVIDIISVFNIKNISVDTIIEVYKSLYEAYGITMSKKVREYTLLQNKLRLVHNGRQLMYTKPTAKDFQSVSNEITLCRYDGRYYDNMLVNSTYINVPCTDKMDHTYNFTATYYISSSTLSLSISTEDGIGYDKDVCVCLTVYEYNEQVLDSDENKNEEEHNHDDPSVQWKVLVNKRWVFHAEGPKNLIFKDLWNKDNHEPRLKFIFHQAYQKEPSLRSLYKT